MVDWYQIMKIEYILYINQLTPTCPRFVKWAQRASNYLRLSTYERIYAEREKKSESKKMVKTVQKGQKCQVKFNRSKIYFLQYKMMMIFFDF